MALIICREAIFAYEGGVVIDRLNLSIETGDWLSVTGENGTGKSTLIKGLLKLKAPKSGSVEYGEGMTLRDVGYLPQQTVQQKDFPASVFEITLSGTLGLKGSKAFYTRADKAAAHENLKRLGVCELSGECYRDLSGGQQRRVLLARALCAAKRMLILDEPTAGLDARSADEFLALIARLNSEDHLTIVCVTHDRQKHGNKQLQLGAAL